jgi:peroxiredoxin
MLWTAALVGAALLAPGALAELSPGSKPSDFGIKNLQGKSVRFSQLRGRSPAIVNFFASY